MEGDALAHGEADRLVVGPLPGGRQLADQLIRRRVAVEQGLEDVAQDGVAVQAVGVPVLEGRRLGGQGDRDLAGRLGRLDDASLGRATQGDPDGGGGQAKGGAALDELAAAELAGGGIGDELIDRAQFATSHLRLLLSTLSDRATAPAAVRDCRQ